MRAPHGAASLRSPPGRASRSRIARRCLRNVLAGSVDGEVRRPAGQLNPFVAVPKNKEGAGNADPLWFLVRERFTPPRVAACGDVARGKEGCGVSARRAGALGKTAARQSLRKRGALRATASVPHAG